MVFVITVLRLAPALWQLQPQDGEQLCKAGMILLGEFHVAAHRREDDGYQNIRGDWSAQSRRLGLPDEIHEWFRARVADVGGCRRVREALDLFQQQHVRRRCDRPVIQSA